MYGLPKTYKKDVPLRPILSMTGSAQRQLAKWLTFLLDPVLQLSSTNCIPDSFIFAETLKNFQFPTSSSFLCSFDISSLFTNVPLQETIEICAVVLYGDNLAPTPFSRKFFIELMQTAT